MPKRDDELLGIIRRSMAEDNMQTRPHVVSLRLSGLDLIRFVRLTNQEVVQSGAIAEVYAPAQAAINDKGGGE